MYLPNFNTHHTSINLQAPQPRSPPKRLLLTTKPFGVRIRYFRAQRSSKNEHNRETMLFHKQVPPARPNLLEYQLSLESHAAKSHAADAARTCSCMEKMFIGALANEEKIVLEGCSPTVRFCYFHNPHTQRPMLSPFSDTSVTEGAVKYIIAEGGRLALNCNRGQKWCRVLHWAIENENTRLVFMAIGHESVDINQRDWFNRTPLHLANFKCSPSLTKLLLNAGANVNAIDDHNAKPLHYAISRWKVELKKKNSQQLDDSMMEVLNLNLEAALTSGEEYFMEDVPLLHFAVEYRHLGVIETLLATRKGDVNVRDARGQTALFVAFRHKLLDMVDLLIVKYGADEGLKEETGQKYNYVAEEDYHYQCDLENLQRRVSQYTARGDIGTSSNYIRPWKNISRYSLNQFESP